MGVLAILGLLIMIAATICLMALSPYEDSSVEELYSMVCEMAWAVGAFLLIVTGAGWTVSALRLRRSKR